jgi:tetratricopeptide (TPR) repeat protein
MLMKLYTTVAILIIVCPLLIAQDSRSTIKSPPSDKGQIIGQTYAIIVGVSDYRNLPSLLYASKDAEIFKRLLQKVGQVPEDHIKVYLDSATTKADITYTWSQWLRKKQIKKGDRIYFYLAGHGDAYNKTQFIFTHDADLVSGSEKYDAEGNVNLTALKQKLITEYVDEYGAEVIFIVDACRTREKEAEDSIKNMQHRFNAANITEKIPGFITLYATNDGSVAYESSKFGGGHGLFTFYLIKGAMGEADAFPKNGIITLYELFRYVEASVRLKSSEIFKIEQQPDLYSDSQDKEKQLFSVDMTINISDDYALQGSLDQKLEKYITKRATNRTFKSKSDSLLLDTYNKFTKSLKAKQLLGSGSALLYYNTLKKNWVNDALTQEAELMLTSELINYSQTFVHLYLLGLDMDYIQRKASSNEPNGMFYQDLSLISSSNFVLAAQCLETAIELIGMGTVTKSLYPKLWFLQARSYFDNPKEVDLNTAIQLAEKALHVDTGSVHIYHLLAMLEVKRKNIIKAELYFKKAIEGQSEYSKEGLKIGYELFKLKRFQEASVFYRLHSVSDKQYAIAYNLLALSSIQNSDMESGKKFFTLALSKDSTADYLRNNATVFYHAMALNATQNNQIDEAERFYLIASKYSPKNLLPSVWTNFGNFYMQSLKSYLQAKSCFEKALQIDPENVTTLNSYAVMYYNSGLASKSVELLDSSIQVSKHILAKTKINSEFYSLAQDRIKRASYAKDVIKNGG